LSAPAAEAPPASSRGNGGFEEKSVLISHFFAFILNHKTKPNGRSKGCCCGGYAEGA
jgi:hypothetical protein